MAKALEGIMGVNILDYFEPSTRNAIGLILWDTNHNAHVDKFEYTWSYYRGVWLEGSSGSVDRSGKETRILYAVPDDVVTIKLNVTVTAKTYKKNKKEHKYFPNQKLVASRTFEYVSADVSAPSTPSCSTSGATLTASNTVNKAELVASNQIQFEFVMDDATVISKPCVGLNDVGYAAASINMSPGHTYKVRSRKTHNFLVWEDITQWSSYSSSYSTSPAVTSITYCGAYDATSVSLSWNAAGGATNGYDVEYVDNPDLFDRGDTQTKSITSGTSAIIQGLDNTGGKKWYFRVRGKNENGEGPWSGYAECFLASVPDAPTIWTYSTVIKVGEDAVLNWIHNSEDSSTQTGAIIEYSVNSGSPVTIYLSTESTYSLNTSSFQDTDTVTWRVRTKGAHADYGPWSDYKQFTLHQPPEVYAVGGIPSAITSFPITLELVATPPTQTALSFAIDITARNGYTTFDSTGALIVIPAGGSVYTGFFDNILNNTRTIMLTPGDMTLDSEEEYSISITAYMSSGLSADVTQGFVTQFEQQERYSSMDIAIDYEDLSVYLYPTCYEYDETNETWTQVTDVLFDIYRINYDGSFTPIAVGIDALLDLTINDPHPSLDVARYRLVTTSKSTGLKTYVDSDGDEIGHKSIVIQWDDNWMPYDEYAYDSSRATGHTGSRLDLPYNIDIQSSSAQDVELVEYIGRSSPVSYYGTQKGVSGSFKVDVPKTDTETLFNIRRLSQWAGDCYIRDPSGIGYWAQITVNYSMTYNKLTIPVTFNVKRVDGGA